MDNDRNAAVGEINRTHYLRFRTCDVCAEHGLDPLVGYCASCFATGGDATDEVAALRAERDELAAVVNELVSWEQGRGALASVYKALDTYRERATDGS